MERHETPQKSDCGNVIDQSLTMIAQVALPLPLQKTFSYLIPQTLKNQIQIGSPVLVPFRNRSLKGIVTGVTQNGNREDAGPLKEISALLSEDLKVSQKFLDLTAWVAETYGTSWGEALTVLSYALQRPSRTARRRKILEETLGPVPDWVLEVKQAIRITGEQEKAIGEIGEGIQSKDFEAFLLFGVTSSGKTEVYLRAIGEVLEKSRRQALYLVPEISLCRPIYEILTERYGSRVGIWHSLVSHRERNETVRGIRDGSIDIVLGARSALFAPLENLGIVIVDEEHDFSYKQDEKPRYHARDVAVQLARIHRCPVVLGSATPSIESYYKSQTGEYKLLTLSQRVPSHSIPEVTLVDRRNNRDLTPGKRLSPLTPPLVEAVRTAISRREQVILALNRRGFSTFVLCRSCGHVWKCPDCRIALVHHRDFEATASRDILTCHLCFHKEEVPAVCTECKSANLLLGGFGTQRVVQEVKKIFPYARVLRLDRDVARKKEGIADTVKSFGAESADILVGTQMVTQGFDFPRVTLVGILDADTALYHPDFRAGERTFQWIVQASGRAGRSSMGGKVLIQTSIPDHYALREAVFGTYDEFYKKELEFRSALRYPPFSHLLLLRVQSALKRDLVVSESEKIVLSLKSNPEISGIEILGPGPTPRENMKKRSRWQILVKAPSQDLLRKTVGAVREYQPKAGVRLVIDVNPYNVL